MRIVATIPARNEAHELGLTARAALMWCDMIILGLHDCTDGTLRIACDLASEFGHERVVWIKAEGDWNEMQHRQALLDMARSAQATHLAIIDADEVITGNLVPRMRDLCAALPAWHMLELPQINLRGSICRMHKSGIWADQHTAIVFRDNPALHWAAAGDGYQHHARAPKGMALRPFRPVRRHDGGLFHLQMANEKRLRAKQYLYQLSDMARWPGRRTAEITRQYYSLSVYGCVPGWIPSAEESWRFAANMPCLCDVPAAWWDAYRSLLPHLQLDGEPWQLAECRRLIAAHPGIEQGLDPFGCEL